MNCRATLILALAAVFPMIGTLRGADFQSLEKIGTLRLADPGPDPTDSTAVLQAAFLSGARTVVIARTNSPWLTGPLFLTNDLTVVFEPGVELLAKAGAFRGKSEALLTANGARNVRLTGPGATLRMRRGDYTGPGYEKAEWRHALSLRSVSNVVVEGLTLAESGGDGIYLGTGPDREPCRDVTIRGVVCDRNHRQGISVISAERLLIEDCVLRDTGGTAPAAGIDFEPNRPTERLVDCTMRRCVIENNAGTGLLVALHQFDGLSAPVSLRFEDCITRGANARSVSLHTINGGTNGVPRGSVVFAGCRFEEAERAGVLITSKPADGIAVSFDRCRFDARNSGPAVMFRSRAGDRRPVGGVTFAECLLLTKGNAGPLAFEDLGGVILENVTGTLTIDREGVTSGLRLDADMLARLVPQDPVLRIPLVPLNLTADNFPAVVVATGAVAEVRVRGAALFALAAQAGETVTVRLRHRRVGRTEAQVAPIHVTAPDGRIVLEAGLEPEREQEIRFTAELGGVYRVTCDPGTHAVAVAAGSHAFVWAADGPLRLIGSTGDFAIRLPAGVTNVGVRVAGQGEGERVGAELVDPRGVSRWRQDDIGWAQSFVIDRPATAPAEDWTLRIRRPASGAFEDCVIELRGLPTVLGRKAR